MYYTITGKIDGFGAQYLAILSGIAYCKTHKYTYIHTPFTTMAHNVDISNANEFIGINTSERLSLKNDFFIKVQFANEVIKCNNKSTSQSLILAFPTLPKETVPKPKEATISE